MLGFSEKDVREMILYYKNAGQLPVDLDVEAMILEMKPWYDNYCFAEESLERDPKIFPSLLFYYGMLTIIATRGNYLVLGIPNNSVHKQYDEFMLEEVL